MTNDPRTVLTTRQRGDCEERVNEQYGYVASRIRRIDGAFGVRFMPYYVSTGGEYFHNPDGGFGFPTIEEARAVLSTY